MRRAPRLAIVSLIVAAALTSLGCWTSRRQNATETPAQVPAPVRDPQIEAILDEIDAARIEQTIRTLASFHTRHTFSDEASQTSGIVAARQWIHDEFQRYASAGGGRLKVEMHETRIERTSERVPRPVTIVNVLATLPGTSDPGRIYLVSGHYDSRASDPNDAVSRAPGANDDASGTAAVLEVARVMSAHQFDATIIFAAVAGEEQGLLGAAALAERAKDDNWNLEAMFTNDIVGNMAGKNPFYDRSRVRVFSEGVPSNETPLQLQARQSVGGENDGPSRQVARYIEEAARAYTRKFGVTMIWRRDRYGRGGDHIPFNRQGFAAVRFTEPRESYDLQHQDVRTEGDIQFGDLPEFVDFDYVASVARVNAAALASMASAPAKVRDVSISTQLEHDTSLSWTPSTEADLLGYAVLARRTTAPSWEHRFDVGNTTRASIPLSKDDYIFAVQAFDREGHASIPVPPLPASRRAPATAPSR